MLTELDTLFDGRSVDVAYELKKQRRKRDVSGKDWVHRTSGKVTLSILGSIILVQGFNVVGARYFSKPELETPTIVDKLAESDEKVYMDGIGKLCFPTKKQYEAIGLNSKLCQKMVKAMEESNQDRGLTISSDSEALPGGGGGLTEAGTEFKAVHAPKSYPLPKPWVPGTLDKTLKVIDARMKSEGKALSQALAPTPSGAPGANEYDTEK